MIQHKIAGDNYMNVGERCNADAVSIMSMMDAIRADKSLESGSIHAFVCNSDRSLEVLMRGIDMLCVYHTLLYRVFKPIRGGYHNVELHHESCSLLIDGRHNLFLFSNADQFYRSQKSVKFDSYKFHSVIITRRIGKS